MTAHESVEFSELVAAVREFAHERDWDQFHSPRNLILALVGEVGELSAEFQWISDTQVDAALRDDVKRDAVGSELADVLIYLIRLADILDYDLPKEVTAKLEINSIRYPADKSKGSSQKYTAYE
jgi:dCTP diphosphatase